MNHILPAIIACLLLSGCARTEDDRIAGVLKDLGSALDKHDVAAASKLYNTGKIPPVNTSGDSSTVYRLLHIPGGADFTIENVRATIIEDRAQATFDLAGKVRRDGKVAGEMTLRLKVELEKNDKGAWMIVSGNEGRE